MGLPQPKVACASQVYTAASPGCSARALSQVVPAFCALPRSKPLWFSCALRGTDWTGCALCALTRCEQLRWPGAWWVHHPYGPCISFTFQVPITQFPRSSTRAQSQVCYVSPLGSWTQAGTLLADVNCPGSRENEVSNRSPAYSWWKMRSLGLRLQQPLAFQLWLSFICLCLRGWGSAFFMVQLSHPYTTTGKTICLTTCDNRQREIKWRVWSQLTSSFSPNLCIEIALVKALLSFPALVIYFFNLLDGHCEKSQFIIFRLGSIF